VLTTSNGKITNLRWIFVYLLWALFILIAFFVYRRATMVVIDEADRMFDLGFEP
jgi:hypothetical protein